MKFCIVILFFFTVHIFAQTDWAKWEKKDYNFQIHENNSGTVDTSSGSSILSVAKKTYSSLISDLDGDNCPFYPTCSSFFVESVNRTNILKGTLMFADRFTRDSNLFKSREHYPNHIHGKLYDPVENYLLTDSTIIVIRHEE
jgi:putative component of membrane protein insertase Oxa1/YidC/SpoIIIJ protein YidD